MTARLVRVACTVPNGLMIRLSAPGQADIMGSRGEVAMGNSGPGVRLNGPSPLHTGVGNPQGAGLLPGVTEVDADWMERWLEQRALDPMVVGRQVYVLGDEDGEPKDPNPTAG